MAIKLTYKIIEDGNFIQALRALKDYPFRNHLFAYNVAKIWRRFNSEFDKAGERWVKLVKQYAVLNESGAFVPKSPEEPNSFKIIDEKKDEFETAKNEFTSTAFEMDCHPLKLSQLEDMPLSAAQIEGLSPLFDFSEEESL